MPWKLDHSLFPSWEELKKWMPIEEFGQGCQRLLPQRLPAMLYLFYALFQNMNVLLKSLISPCTNHEVCVGIVSLFKTHASAILPTIHFSWEACQK